MKKYILKLISLFSAIALLSIGNLRVFAADTHSWYIKRNGNSRPGFPSDAELLDEYGCYYIDKSCDESNKRIYITFDAGYENGNVARILDVLKNENVPAAFFVLDNIILKNTDLVKRMVDEGHMVCNHTKRHKDLSCATSEECAKDLLELEEIYEKYTGRTLSKYFRFPEGKYSIDAVKYVNELGYKTIFWSFAYDDWDNNRQMDRAAAMKKVLDNTHPGAVMLFHPTSKVNAEIFGELISAWRDMGYSFGTLDELTK